MKLAITVLAMGLCTITAPLHAWQAGTIRFTGSIVQETCAYVVAANRSPEPRRVPGRCAPAATSVGGGNASAYTEQVTMVSAYSGIDVLDYYNDSVRSGSSEPLRVLTRAYH